MQTIPGVVDIRDQHLYGSESNIDRFYKGGNVRVVVIPQSRIVEVWDQNLHGSESNIDQIYEGGNLRSVAMPQGKDQILLSPGRNIDGNLPRENNYDNVCGKGNDQNVYGYHPTQDSINMVSGRTGSYQLLTTNDQVSNPDGVGLDLNYQRAQDGFSSHPNASQLAPKPRAESNSIDFSQSLTQILSSLGHNLNANPKEGFAILSACTNTWKERMTSRHNNQEKRILGLEHT